VLLAASRIARAGLAAGLAFATALASTLLFPVLVFTLTETFLPEALAPVAPAAPVTRTFEAFLADALSFLLTDLFLAAAFFTAFFTGLAVLARFNLTRFLVDAWAWLEMEAFFRDLVTALDLVAIGATLTLTFALVFGLLVSDSLIIELPN
jgi:hypothetical protein